jgi:ElaA protein
VPPVEAVRSASVADLDPTTLYAILRLRTDVFVVEQDCPYPELDGRDLEPDARQLWIEQDGAVVATLRLLKDDGEVRIGRVATAPPARGTGLAAMLMQRALELVAEDDPDADIVLDAQSYLANWYERLGFRRDGDEYVEDGIPHVPMRLRAG